MNEGSENKEACPDAGGHDRAHGVVPLLGLTSINTEKAGENSTIDEDSNQPTRLAPLLGTTFLFVDVHQRSTNRRNPTYFPS